MGIITNVQEGFNFAQLLGFLGLIGIAILILIYLLKPNYQQKFISSTHVWKLSLKYKRRKIPISRMKNIIVILCQILIITMGAFILAQPYVGEAGTLNRNEKIIIIDSSANMQAVNERGVTRFDTAVQHARAEAEAVIKNNGKVSIIQAAKTATAIVTQADSIVMFNESVVNLECSYSIADIRGAMDIADVILKSNPRAEVVLYTATEYLAKGNVTVNKISDIDDSFKSVWNVAILDVAVTKGVINPTTGEIDHDERYNVFEVKAASFGKDAEFIVHIQIEGVIGDDIDSTLYYSSEIMDIEYLDGEVQTFQFNRHPDWVDIEWYETAKIWIDEKVIDSFSLDNSFFVYGGKKESINVQYVSTDASDIEKIAPHHNAFLTAALMGVKNILNDNWVINVFANSIVPADRNYVPPENGADVYIFEHYMPTVIPTDGIVILINPDVLPNNLDGNSALGMWQGRVDSMGEVVAGDDVVPSAPRPHQLLNNFDPSKVTISKYRELIYDAELYQSVLYDPHTDDTLLLARNTSEQKVAILPFSLHYSNLPVLIELPSFMYNIFDYFLPSTLTKYAYDVDDVVHISPRGHDLLIRHQSGVNQHPSALDNEDARYTDDELPIDFVANQIGTYHLTFTFMDREPDSSITAFFVKIAQSESDFSKVVAELVQPAKLPDTAIPWDLILFFASALVALLFLERILDNVDP